MLENMFIGKPPGNYDRLLDFSRPVTGTLFFVPSAAFLDEVAAAPPAVADSTPQPAEPAMTDESLGIGSLKKDVGQET
jgi:putative iron-dependent peroxidase